MPSKCQNRSFTIESCHSSVSNRVRSKVTSLNDGWESPKTEENFKTPVTLVKGVCGWMASFWGSETNRVRDEEGPKTEENFKTPVTLVKGFVDGWQVLGSETNRVRDEVPMHIERGPLTQAFSLKAVWDKVMVRIDEGYLPDAGKIFKASVSRMVFSLYQSFLPESGPEQGDGGNRLRVPQVGFFLGCAKELSPRQDDVLEMEFGRYSGLGFLCESGPQQG
ncbi:hypothetical protein U1Q18_044200 [Sarracenia purpurea var. burkii]